MIVPTDNNPITSPRRDRRNLPPSQSNADNVVPLSPSARPSEAQLLMALATMHQQGRIIPGAETLEERTQGLRRDIRRSKTNPVYKEGPVDRILSPGEELPDTERGGESARTVKGT